jgi:exo-1,4-beta-D-glucosaminidase
MTALNYLAKVPLDISAHAGADDDAAGRTVTVSLHNPTAKIAFFERAELLATDGGDEILPIEYDDNYVTVFPGETVEITGRVPAGGPEPTWVRVTGYGGVPVVVAVR